MNKAESGDAANGVKLVLPQGGQVGASYTVSGTIANTSIAQNYKSLTVFNSGGADVQATSQNPTFRVTGDMVHSDEGQTVAFYTENPPKTKISLKASYYDPVNGWTIEDDPADNVGPDATLNFSDLPEGVVESDNSIELFIFDESHKTFSVRETYTNTDKYKFIGWYGKNGATPRDISLDNKEFGDAEVTGLTVTNDPEKIYYALYVPYSDGTLTLSHTESQTSIGYPKKLSVEVQIGSNPSVRHEFTTNIDVEHAVDHDHQKVHTEIRFENFREPRTPAEEKTAFNIDLEAMSGYGCVHYNTYEEGRALDRSTRIVDDNTVINVYMDPSYTDENHPETLWNYTVVGIEDYAFMNRSDLKTLYLQYGTKLTTIGKFAFYGCSSFRYAEVPPMVETIGEGAFQDCSGLEKVVFDNQKITAIENQTFYGCSSLTAIELPGSVVSIGDLAFADCDSLQRIIIPAGVTAIGDSAFARSDALVIYCYKGSYAHRYAMEKNIPFVLLDSGAEGYLLGDTDDNGDVDGDGDPTIVDATFIMRYCVGIVTPYGIGEPV